jgi:hypothetical protein
LFPGLSISVLVDASLREESNQKVGLREGNVPLCVTRTNSPL